MNTSCQMKLQKEVENLIFLLLLAKLLALEFSI